MGPDLKFMTGFFDYTPYGVSLRMTLQENL